MIHNVNLNSNLRWHVLPVLYVYVTNYSKIEWLKIQLAIIPRYLWADGVKLSAVIWGLSSSFRS